MNKLTGTLTALFAGAVTAATPVQVMAEQGAKSLRDGERMIEQCLSYAASQKYPAMSVAVIDASGTLIAFKRQDGASAATADAALLKARTALRLNASTAELGPALAGDTSTRDTFLILQMTTLPGGFPIADANGQAIAAVGASGGLGEQDAKCAQLAAEPARIKGK